MYFLDTNALYWYMGRDKIGDSSCAKVDEHALRSFLDKRIDDKALASSAYIEAMVKFRNQPDKAMYLHRFLLDKNLRLFNNVQYKTFSTDQMSAVFSLSEEMLCNYINKDILPAKIDIEYRFTIFFFMSILLLYTKCVINNSFKICPNHDRDIESFVTEKATGDIEEEFKKTIEEAYEKHELYEQQILKDKYIELLERECKMVDKLIEVLSTKNGQITESDISEVEERVRKEYDELKLKRQDNYLMEHIHKELISNQKLIEEARKRFSEMFSSKGEAFIGKERLAFNKTQIDYLSEEMYKSWMENGQKFRKNDIFDFFFLGCMEYKDNRNEDILVDTSTYLLTFDRRLDRYIEHKNPNNGIEIRRFYNDF